MEVGCRKTTRKPWIHSPKCIKMPVLSFIYSAIHRYRWPPFISPWSSPSQPQPWFMLQFGKPIIIWRSWKSTYPKNQGSDRIYHISPNPLVFEIRLSIRAIGPGSRSTDKSTCRNLGRAPGPDRTEVHFQAIDHWRAWWWHIYQQTERNYVLSFWTVAD